MTVHSHVRLQFRYFGNRSALTLKPHQKTDLSLSGSLVHRQTWRLTGVRSTILHPYALCTFPKSEALQHARRTCTIHTPQHSKLCTIEEHSSNCISVLTKFCVTLPKFPEVKMPMFVHCAMHVHYATHHQMQRTIELRTLNFINVPKLVSLAQNFLEPENPSRIKFLGPGACSLHPTRTTTRKVYRLWQCTCDLQV